MEVPLPVLITLLTLFGGGLLSWAAYVTKQLVEHARLLAVVVDRTDRIAFASKGPHEDEPA